MNLDPMAVIHAWAKCLRPQGVAIFSCWGPDTLKELRGALTRKWGGQSPCTPWWICTIGVIYRSEMDSPIRFDGHES
jgi:hypothetical protein